MWRKTPWLLGVIYAATLVWVPYWYSQEQRARSRNFRVVSPNVLYRCGQLNQEGLAKIIFDHGIRTVVSLRFHDGKEHPSKWEEAFCLGQGVVFHRIPIRDWHAVNGGELPLAEKAREFNRMLADPVNFPRPILLHCFAGMHRTGALVAVYRMEHERWSNDEAIAEMAECGYTELEEDIGEFLRGYQPHWRRPATRPWVSERMESGYSRDGKWVSKSP